MLLLMFRPVQWGSLSFAVGIMAVLAILFAVIIVVVSKYTAIKGEDPRIAEVRKLVAGANCGGCGKAGCDDYAKALCQGTASLKDCGPTSNESKEKIAEILGLEFSSGGGTRAVVHCIGGNKCKDKYEYTGLNDCTMQNMLLNGKKLCDNACLGCLSCGSICPTGALSIEDGVAVVNKELCISCGACVTTCPKNIIEIIPDSAKVFVGCSNTQKGKDVMTACEVGCIGCSLCEKKCPQGAITMVNNLPVIDYNKCVGCFTCVNTCPRHSIKAL